MASMNLSSSLEHPEVSKTPDMMKEEEEQKKREAERAKSLQVRKVSPVKKFFSSIRVKFLCVIIFFAVLAAVAITAAATYLILIFYEDMDTLDMKKRVQNAVIGLQRGGNTLTSRGMSAGMNVFMPLMMPLMFGDYSLLYDVEQCEQAMAFYAYGDPNMVNYLDGMGPVSYSVPIQLLMVWDENWTERLVYYRPCNDTLGTDHCDEISRDHIFVDLEHGDYRLAQKDKVPSFFRNLTKVKPTTCDEEGCLGIATDIPPEEGGPFFFALGASMYGAWIPALAGWHYLVGYNMRLLQQVQANRTGLCVSGFSSTEKDLPDFVVKELNKKKEKGLVLDPHDYYPGTRIIRQNTDQVTMDQEYYSRTTGRYDDTGRMYCDASYDHGDDDPVARTYAYFAYYGYDLSTGNLSKNDIYLVRFDYHDPLTAELFPKVELFLLILMIVWLVAIAGMIIYFNQAFLVPLDNMRKMRADFIKTILQGLDDDGALAQQVFGDMLDDSALIEANGDEISVMRTLQDRVDALYSKIIKNRQDDLTRIRNHALRGFNALKLMTFFLRRDDDNLRSILPGLMDSSEMARRFRRTNIADPADKTPGVQELISARHTFRSLKSILNNHIVTEFFKTFCTQRGRSTVNSFFFLMDVSWLSQVEGAARSENEDFLSSLFAETVPQTPAGGATPLATPRSFTLDESNGMASSTDLLIQSSHDLPEENRPHHSHFAKSKAAGNKKSPVVPTLNLGSNPQLGASGSNSPGSPGSPAFSPGGSPRFGSPGITGSPRFVPLGSPKTGVQNTQFLTKNGETIAHFIHDRYFGRKSLAQSDLKHAALLGCSQVPDYLTLRDKSNLVFSPVMYNNLVAAVSKKIANDVIPQFLNSTAFQVMVFSLLLSGYFEKAEKTNANRNKYVLLMQEPEQEAVKEEVSGVGLETPLIHSVWSVCKGAKDDDEVHKDDDDDSSSDGDDDDDDDSSSDDDDDEDDKDEDKKEKEQ